MKHYKYQIIACLWLSLYLFLPLNAMSIHIKPAPLPPAPIHEKWAILIGAGDYRDSSIPKLRFTSSNVHNLAKILKDPQIGRFKEKHVVTIANENATRYTIEETLLGSWLTGKALPNDLVVLYLCGRTIPGKDNKQLYFCTYDTLASEPENSAVELQSLLSGMKHRLQSQRIICLMDTSPALENIKAGFPTVEDLAKNTGVAIFSADNFSEPSYEMSGGEMSGGEMSGGEMSGGEMSGGAISGGATPAGATPAGTTPVASPTTSQSYFTHYFIEGLKPLAGYAPLPVVAQYTAQKVHSDVQKILHKNEMPILAIPTDATIMEHTGIGVVPQTAAKKIAIGHPLDDLQRTRPDLIPTKSKPVEKEEDEDTPQDPVDFGSYIAKMKQDIQKKWQPPKGFESRHVATVFTIHRDGTITEPSIVSTSGVESVDTSALDALKLASPLDPLPPGAPRSVQIRYQFDWKVNRVENQ